VDLETFVEEPLGSAASLTITHRDSGWAWLTVDLRAEDRIVVGWYWPRRWM